MFYAGVVAIVVGVIVAVVSLLRRKKHISHIFYVESADQCAFHFHMVISPSGDSNPVGGFDPVKFATRLHALLYVKAQRYPAVIREGRDFFPDDKLKILLEEINREMGVAGVDIALVRVDSAKLFIKGEEKDGQPCPPKLLLTSQAKPWPMGGPRGRGV
ncbi:MAG: hypothetical protein PHV93_00590 [Candidatus Pacebacteria bacterium]|nr:hypothetical protein [Candidatus Paceibacterota bacterium]